MLLVGFLWGWSREACGHKLLTKSFSQQMAHFWTYCAPYCDWKQPSSFPTSKGQGGPPWDPGWNIETCNLGNVIKLPLITLESKSIMPYPQKNAQNLILATHKSPYLNICWFRTQNSRSTHFTGLGHNTWKVCLLIRVVFKQKSGATPGFITSYT